MKAIGQTEQGCANLAASTDEGNFFTFQDGLRDGSSGCWVQKTNKGRVDFSSRIASGFISGNRACGVPSKYSTYDMRGAFLNIELLLAEQESQLLELPYSEKISKSP